MKGFKTYISMYPVWYRFVVFLIVPVVIIANGLMVAIAGMDYNTGIVLGMSAGLLPYGELFGEWFTLGEICVRKGAFGEVVLSSPNAKVFVRRFAVFDALRKVIGYPLIFCIQQLIIFFVAREKVNLFDAVVLGIICSAAVHVGILILRHTKAIAMRFVSYLAMGLVMGLLGAPYLNTNVFGIRLIIAVIAVFLAALFTYLSIKTILKSAREDYYD